MIFYKKVFYVFVYFFNYELPLISAMGYPLPLSAQLATCKVLRERNLGWQKYRKLSHSYRISKYAKSKLISLIIDTFQSPFSSQQCVIFKSLI